MPIHGRNTVFKVSDVSGSPANLVDLSSFSDSVSITYDGEELDATTFHPTSTTRVFLSGFSTGSLSATGKWDKPVEDFFDDIRGMGDLHFEYGPEGDDGGKTKITGALVFRSYTGPESNVDSVTTWAAEFRLSGDVSLDTY